eukprot:gnl/MRDRNA2_/MRDRNA2_27947_c0_seq1.p1 gnl/MRDRNA2_/MRDRNA2_27947_c0~~gnl/MRDRNA2_/MRDRNA2_27947_c0_seq1.p1  ORF type:complete len:415 (+),score=72.46 gnl/MRDRNA2_/MRDRNA2_27947_c0_seq1:110-1354(+)
MLQSLRSGLRPLIICERSFLHISSSSRRSFATLRSCVIRDSAVELHFDDGRHASLPGVYLRDSCRCESCFHPTTFMRTVRTYTMNPSHLEPRNATVNDGILSIDWADGHKTNLSGDWLSKRIGRQTMQMDVHHWDAEWLNMNMDEVTFKFEDVIGHEGAGQDWLDALWRFGLTRLVGAPCEVGQLEHLGETLSLPLRKSIYGTETFDVKSKPDPNNQAYTADALMLHTDLPYYEKPPDIQILHCIESAPGGEGESLFSDGFAAAKKLQETDAAAFDMLANTPVVFEDINPSQYHLEAMHPVLKVDPRSGDMVAVNLNDGVRSSFLNERLVHRPTEIKAHFEAMYKYQLLVSSDCHAFKRAMLPGEMWAFNNRRVLHGRCAFQPSAPRFLQGCYFEWDDVHSKRRLLRAGQSSNY